ncbi:hypothetical protein [Paraliomyxa miuraensis]|uniref:hypothetical protein n=1 Tax=Paraliomyxa miuraensis TaxID=376150 RepID=UPI00224E882A|nr:hypothetical protein [Paraliomyxa miuraensis]MCX4247740.1 hypothetical protein [Paraliomyxa miuraensis]
MDDIKRLQQQWLEASRRHHAPSEAAVRRMRRGLRTRIEAGEPAPSVVEPEPEAPAPAASVGPWLWGAGVLLAAAAALLLWVGQGGGTQITRASESNAASYDAKERDAAQAARTRPQGVARASAEPTSEASAPIPGERPPAPAPGARTRARGPDSALAPSPRASVGGDQSALAPRPSVEAAGLDVAGEVAVLRRAKAAIEGRDWARASSVLVEYEQSYPGGVLALDARALRVLVDCHQRATNAVVRATDFLQRHPSSSLRDRIRDACAIDRD